MTVSLLRDRLVRVGSAALAAGAVVLSAPAASVSAAAVADTAPPAVAGQSVSPSSVEVSYTPMNVTVSVRLTDETGVDTTRPPFARLVSGTSYRFVDLALASGTVTDGVWSGTSTFRHGDGSRTWTADAVAVSDTAQPGANEAWRPLSLTFSVVDRVPTKVYIAVRPATISLGATSSLTGTLVRTDTSARLPNRIVTLFTRRSGTTAWTRVGTLRTDAAGNYGAPQRPAYSSQYYTTYAGSSTEAPRSSPVVGITVVR